MPQGTIEAPRLDTVLNYRNEDVIASFRDSLAVEATEAETVFIEMLKFLWFCDVERDRSMQMIDSPIIILDEMWHTFILFTREYQEFSLKYFGRYLHHAPTTVSEKHAAAAAEHSAESRQKLVDEQRCRYTRIYERLGRETFIRWFYEFPEKYSSARIRELRKK